ncbi:MAG: hypothetical protein NTZ48_07605 [Candidatus Omnitrophica bacterium]|nr:hypothetical protein [Candidatus Omnitrophota bacterium]
MVGSILISLYDIYRNDVDIRSSMNALAANPITSVTDNLGGVSFTRQNRNEQAKTYVSLRKDNMLLLNQLIQAYRSRSCQPSAVAGDDTLASEWGNIYTYRPFTTRVGPY